MEKFIKWVDCPCCNGSGSIEVYSNTYDIYYSDTCNFCYGNRKVESDYILWLERGGN
jgi:DnaJ-class molecular chaperone